MRLPHSGRGKDQFNRKQLNNTGWGKYKVAFYCYPSECRSFQIMVTVLRCTGDKDAWTLELSIYLDTWHLHSMPCRHLHLSRSKPWLQHLSTDQILPPAFLASLQGIIIQPLTQARQPRVIPPFHHAHLILQQVLLILSAKYTTNPFSYPHNYFCNSYSGHNHLSPRLYGNNALTGPFTSMVALSQPFIIAATAINYVTILWRCLNSYCLNIEQVFL